jgi:hypothetical protein
MNDNKTADINSNKYKPSTQLFVVIWQQHVSALKGHHQTKYLLKHLNASFLGVLSSILPEFDPLVSKQGAIKIATNKIVFTERTYIIITKHNRVSNFKIHMKSLHS